MTIQDLGAIGEVLAAIATIATLVYLAAQVRQNTRALRSSTFQAISQEMAANVQPILMEREIAALLQKGMRTPEGVTPEERIRFHAMLSMTLRRMEAVHVQSTLGSIDQEHMAGFERSIFSILHSPGASRWWREAKVNFNARFVAHVDEWLQENPASRITSSLLLESAETDTQRGAAD